MVAEQWIRGMRSAVESSTRPDHGGTRRGLLLALCAVALVSGPIGCHSLEATDDVVDIERFRVVDYDVRAWIRRSTPDAYKKYVFAFHNVHETDATAYGYICKVRTTYAWVMGEDTSREDLSPQIEVEDLMTLRVYRDLDMLVECIRSPADPVYTLPPERLFKGGKALLPIRALTPEEIATLRRLAAEEEGG